MEKTTSLEIEPLLLLEMDFSYTPGIKGKMSGHPDLWYPDENPEYDIKKLRVYHKNKWHHVPEWLSDILQIKYHDQLVAAADQALLPF